MCAPRGAGDGDADRSTGSNNITAAQYAAATMDGDVYVSHNGGRSFRKVLDDVHYCRFLDQGTLAVCVPGYNYTSFLWYVLRKRAPAMVDDPGRLGSRSRDVAGVGGGGADGLWACAVVLSGEGGGTAPTPARYSLDQGLTWRSVQFIASSTPVDVAHLVADPATFGLDLIIYGTLQSGNVVVVAVDMSPLFTRNCAADR